MNSNQNSVRRRTLSTRLKELKQASVSQPRQGWIFEIRKLLGMRSEQLAQRLGVTQSSVSRIERSEREKKITLQSLANVAEALNCEFYYCFIPKQDMESYLMERAEQMIKQETQRITKTMALEEQPIPLETDLTLTIRAAILLQNADRRIWDDDE